MKISRITAQRGCTLREFYSRAAEEFPALSDILNGMVELIDYVEATISSPDVFGVTSHLRLRLVAKNDYRSETLVVIAPDVDVYDVSYELAPDFAPWDNAWVHGQARCVAEATEMIAIALLNNTHCRNDLGT
ncbi:hypothetical protein KOR34_43850 [Posidoniimonas corsicana]|uniref:Uncharacterized protein n=1 Tax=Posidoniimonas corsicana TaxID=1938618 RepID=A0A5C5UXE3_9BACT|nr:hypothetical protein [Posidoniimonas corsicana]TWT31011.1 hypothetical protein KOR34_43850 [Posidoniimonas corsicana]